MTSEFAVADYIGVSLLPQRIASAVTAVAGLVGLLLVGIGVYGITAFTVAQRAREMGVRRALGAERGDVLRLVEGEGVKLAGSASSPAGSCRWASDAFWRAFCPASARPTRGSSAWYPSFCWRWWLRDASVRRCGLRGWIRCRRCVTSRGYRQKSSTGSASFSCSAAIHVSYDSWVCTVRNPRMRA